MEIVGNEKYECDICEISFSEANAVKKHVHSVHNLKKQIYTKKKHVCNLCIKEFQSPYKRVMINTNKLLTTDKHFRQAFLYNLGALVGCRFLSIYTNKTTIIGVYICQYSK